jgi:hypothetical protein
MRAPASAVDRPASLAAAAAAVAVDTPALACGSPGFFFAEQAAIAAASKRIANTFRVDMW